MPSQSYSITGIILKRVNVGEYDRIVTILSQEDGKQAYVAKGVRRTTASSGSYFEPGNTVQAHCIHTKGLPILTQAKLLKNTATIEKTPLQTFVVFANFLRYLMDCLLQKNLMMSSTIISSCYTAR